MIFNNKVWSLEVKNFLLGNTVLWGFVSLMLFGLYGFFHGNNVIERQEQILAKIPSVQTAHIQTVVEHGKGKTVGSTAYYPFFYTTNPPSPWAKFSIGQRDVNPFNLKVKMLGIEGQLHDSELTNPLTLLVGNLDASFVFIFLFPLLIIAFTYNTLSEEQESGVWKIVRISSSHTLSVIARKLLIRLAVVLLTSAIVFLMGMIYLSLPFSLPSMQLGIVLLCYVIFWFTLALMIISFGKSSSFNATVLVCLWIFLCILFPGIANIIIDNKIPVPEAQQTAIKQREGYHQKWDMPKKPTMETFYASYPEYRKYPIPEDKYSSGWYYAMQYAGDVESSESSDELFKKLEQRQNLSDLFGQFNPVIAAQQHLNKIANTDLANHIQYLRSVKRHHKSLREYFYPGIFQETLTENLDWNAHPKYEPAGYVTASLLSGIVSMLLWSIAIFFTSTVLFKRNFIHITDKQNA
ncbi:ABC-2 type transport system permease protein [Dyadobacter koreensis]|uniref:ABC-2 type transport system permease protein n=1 Tax=Dyadobacter koreensis TaxID=408657 RepID=A0A1H6QD13_9BACT|nr:DUF3526 domain-containing protein [Dyadobacter koreensis]SEI37135.1 ABC-2 type transport system permease protein [Dyadobacter koreensis]